VLTQTKGDPFTRYTFAPPQPDDSAASLVHFRTAAYIRKIDSSQTAFAQIIGGANSSCFAYAPECCGLRLGQAAAFFFRPGVRAFLRAGFGARLLNSYGSAVNRRTIFKLDALKIFHPDKSPKIIF
jgi:hypothetical protein